MARNYHSFISPAYLSDIFRSSSCFLSNLTSPAKHVVRPVTRPLLHCLTLCSGFDARGLLQADRINLQPAPFSYAPVLGDDLQPWSLPPVPPIKKDSTTGKKAISHKPILTEADLEF